MKIQKNLLLLLLMSGGGLVFSLFLYVVFLVIPIVSQCQSWSDLLILVPVKPQVPRYLSLLLGGMIVLIFGWLLLFTLRQIWRLLPSLVKALKFADYLAAGKLPPPMHLTDVKNFEIGNLLRALNTVRDRLASCAVRLRSSHTRELKARKDAETGAELKSMVIARMAPDIRVPLNSISGRVELLKRRLNKSEAPGEKLKLLADIERSGLEIAGLIDRMVNLDEIGRMDAESEVTQFNTTDFMKQVVENNTPLCQTRKITLHYVFSGNAPDNLCSDRNILLHLLSVMIRAVFRASGLGEELIVSCVSENEKIAFVVRDNRKVVSREHLADMYNVSCRSTNSHSRLDSSSTVLGLHFVDTQAANIGGMLQAKSTDEASTELVLLFNKVDITGTEPVAPIWHTRSAENKHKDNHKTGLISTKKYHILLGEEDPDNAEVIKTILTEDNFTVAAYATGAELLAAAGKERFDAAVISNAMRHRNMIAAIQKLRHLDGSAAMPIMVIASKLSADKKLQLQAVGVNSILIKPLDFEVFSGQLRELCSRLELTE